MDDPFDLHDFAAVARLFPLPGVVLLPHVVLPLHVFEPRYRQMTRDALADDRLIAMIQTRPDADWSLGEPALEPVGCLGRILRHEPLPDGRFNFLLLGLRRARIVRELEVSTLYRQAEVELVDDVKPALPAAALRAELIARFHERTAEAGPLHPDLSELLSTDVPLGPLTDLLAHALGLPAAVRQALLAEPHVGLRADYLLAFLERPGRAARPRPYPPPFSPN